MTSTLEISEVDEATRKLVLEKFTTNLSQADLSLPPARTAGASYQQILAEIGQEDLFLSHKRSSIKAALELYPRLKEIIQNTADPLNAAIRVSALGNILDVANPYSYDINNEIDQLMKVKIWGDSLEIFRDKLTKSDSLLILADNAAETVFDRVLIEFLDIPVIYTVKSAPAFDDALLEDAQAAGIDQIAQVIESGTPFPGTYLPSCSSEFREIFESAPLILAKGQANFETLNDVDRSLFFLLKVKCEVVSGDINYPIGSLALKYHTSEVA
jgi:uncharacterized protein with ATP-grasp and redox domains